LQEAIWQVPVAQVAVALARVHAVPQPPQFVVVVSGASQPLPMFASQLPYPALQLIPHVPELQEAVPLAVLHAVLQLPQCVGSVSTLVSHPSPVLPLQLAQPAAHVSTHTPEVQAEVAWFVLHAVAQLPQWVTSLFRFDSQPLARVPSQFPKPPLQVIPHTPAVQVAVPLTPLHAVVHVLQCVGSVLRLISQPFDALPSQLPYPALQLMPHTPPVQLGVPLLLLQVVPHPPQFVTLVFLLTSQPLSTLPSQLANPAAQVMPHTPPEHDAVPLVLLHTFGQLPQWFTSLANVTSQPFEALPSQLP
jgi:hypothetical protein